MPNPGLTPEEHERRRKALIEAKGNIAKASRLAGIRSTSTFESWARSFELDLLTKLRAENTATPDPIAEPEAPEPEPEHIREIQRLRDEKSVLKRQLRDAARETNAFDDLREAAFSLGEPIPPRQLRTPRPDKGDDAAEIPILFTSDFQWGERIDSREMDGLNAFDREIASRRYERLINSTIDLCLKHHTGRPPKKFYYLRGGDAISGEIHEELAETNDLTSIPAVMDLIEHEEAGIERIQKELDCEVAVISVPGNHDRMTKKPRAKGYVMNSLDTFIAWSLERYFKTNERVGVSWSPSPDAVFEIYGRRFLMTHGDQMGSSGGQGFIGPAATIQRGHKKMVDYYASIGTPIYCVLTGHFHESLKLSYGYANGSLPGYSEYARSKMRARPAPPFQWLLHVHPLRGIVSAREIMVGGEGEGLLCDMALGMAA